MTTATRSSVKLPNGARFLRCPPAPAWGSRSVVAVTARGTKRQRLATRARSAEDAMEVMNAMRRVNA